MGSFVSLQNTALACVFVCFETALAGLISIEKSLIDSHLHYRALLRL